MDETHNRFYTYKKAERHDTTSHKEPQNLSASKPFPAPHFSSPVTYTSSHPHAVFLHRDHPNGLVPQTDRAIAN